MRISDWSSDVCSSDLAQQTGTRRGADRDQQAGEGERVAEGLHAPVGREDRAAARKPQQDRADSDRDRRDRAALVAAAVVVHHNVEFVVAAAPGHRLDNIGRAYRMATMCLYR